jgi:hypothetical protein
MTTNYFINIKNILLVFLICFISINSYAESYSRSYCAGKTYQNKTNELINNYTAARDLDDDRGACSQGQQVIVHFEKCKPYWSEKMYDQVSQVKEAIRPFCKCANNPNARGC